MTNKASNAESLLAQTATVTGLLEAAQRKFESETAAQFNLFVLLGANENATSKALADLLDPNGSHSQGDMFLRHFVRLFFPDLASSFNMERVQRSATTELIDVTLTDGRLWLGIENKIFDAIDQNKQVDRYLEALNEKAGRQGEYRLLYLSSQGQPPGRNSFTEDGERSHAGKKLVCGAWAPASDRKGNGAGPCPTILDWLAECLKECRAEKVREFLKQFDAYVRLEVNAERQPNMVDAAIVELALQNRNNLAGALRISDSRSGFAGRIQQDFVSEIEQRLEKSVRERGADWEVCLIWHQGRFGGGKKDLPILLRRESWPLHVGAAIEAAGDEFRDICIGIRAVTKEQWDNDSKAVPYYGQPQKPFIGPSSRQRLESRPSSGWWPSFYRLRDAEEREISDWRRSDVLLRLYSDRDGLSAHIVKSMWTIADFIEDKKPDAF
ncbi:MAG: PD-(D/E)XK nuclease family protein [Parvularculaceae bacterium]